MRHKFFMAFNRVPRWQSHNSVNSIISGRNPQLYCRLLTLIAMQVHQNRGKIHDEPGYDSVIFLYWVWDRVRVLWQI